MRELLVDDFIEAARVGHLEEVKNLLKADPTLLEKENYIETTALMEAVRENHREIVEFLVSQGADVNHANRTYQTALWHAVARDNAGLTQYLLEQGADPNMRLNGSLNMVQQARKWKQAKNLPVSEAEEVLKKWPGKAKFDAEKKQRILDAKCAAYSPGLKKPMPLPKSPFRRLK